MSQAMGASAVADQALVNQAPAGLGPSGFDPSRDRLQAFRAAQDDARKIALAADRAGPAEKAGSWLSAYGKGCVGSDAGSISWTPAFAGACRGAKEAGVYIEKAVIMMLPAILGEAQHLAEADMLDFMKMLHRDNDGNPKGGNEVPSRSDDSVGPKDIAQ